MNSTRKILLVKTRMICRRIFKTRSNNYHGPFCKEQLTTFSHQKQPPEVFSKKRSKKFREIHRETPMPESIFQ